MKAYQRISLYYLILGIVWISASDHVVVAIAPDPQLLVVLQTIKGWAFVLLSSLLIYSLTKRAFHKAAQLETEKREIFKKTIEGVDHILLNYLNQMQLVTIEARNSDDFDPEVLELAEQISDEAVVELRNLESLNFKVSDDIESFIYRKLRETRQSIERSAHPEK